MSAGPNCSFSTKKPRPDSLPATSSKSCLLRHVQFVAEGRDAGIALAQHLDGAILAEHGERAGDLDQWLGQLGQIGALRRVAEEAVERLLDHGEVDQDLLGHLVHEQPLLGPPRNFVELGNLQCRQGLAAQQRGQAVGDGIDLMAEFGPDLGEVLERAFEQQQRGGKFERVGIAVAGGRGGQRIGRFLDGGSQTGDFGLAQFADAGNQL